MQAFQLSNKTIRTLIDISIVFLVISLVYDIFSLMPAIAWGIITMAIYFICYRLARQAIEPNWKYYLWMFVPTAIFVVIPTIYQFNFSDDLPKNAFLMLRTIIPIGLLVIARIQMPQGD